MMKYGKKILIHFCMIGLCFLYTILGHGLLVYTSKHGEDFEIEKSKSNLVTIIESEEFNTITASFHISFAFFLGFLTIILLINLLIFIFF